VKMVPHSMQALGS